MLNDRQDCITEQIKLLWIIITTHPQVWLQRKLALDANQNRRISGDIPLGEVWPQKCVRHTKKKASPPVVTPHFFQGRTDGSHPARNFHYSHFEVCQASSWVGQRWWMLDGNQKFLSVWSTDRGLRWSKTFTGQNISCSDSFFRPCLMVAPLLGPSPFHWPGGRCVSQPCLCAILFWSANKRWWEHNPTHWIWMARSPISFRGGLQKF